MTALTFSEIEAEAQSIVASASTYERNLYAVFFTMYNLGCREAETTDKTLWTQTGTFTATLQPLKGGTLRAIARADVDPLFWDFLFNTTWYTHMYSLTRLRTFVNQFSNYSSMWVGNKQVSSHLFRYYRFKKMNDDGIPLHDISIFMGEASDTNTQGYIDAIIEVP